MKVKYYNDWMQGDSRDIMKNRFCICHEDRINIFPEFLGVEYEVWLQTLPTHLEGWNSYQNGLDKVVDRAILFFLVFFKGQELNFGAQE